MPRAPKRITVEGGASRVVRDRLAALVAAHPRHVLTPRAVLADAESPSSPLHKRFTWDDDKAAARWRLHQARILVASVRVTVTVVGRGPVETRAYISLRDPDGARAYQPRETTAGAVLDAAREDMRQDVLNLVRKWGGLSTIFWQVVDEIRRAVETEAA
jgi:mitochondrial fission protein ELM1